MDLSLWPVISVSLKVALFSTVAVMIASFFLASIFVKTRSPVVKFFEFLVYLPMAMPPVALGYGLLLLLGKHSLVGRFVYDAFGIELAFSFLGAVIAAFSVSLGIGVRTLRVALENIDRNQLDIARLLGAKRLQVFFHVVLPQCKRALLGGGILVFIRALSEFGATMIFAGNSFGETRTLALSIWIDMETPGKEREAFLLVIIAALISLAALISAEIFLRKQDG